MQARPCKTCIAKGLSVPRMKGRGVCKECYLAKQRAYASAYDKGGSAKKRAQQRKNGVPVGERVRVLGARLRRESLEKEESNAQTGSDFQSQGGGGGAGDAEVSNAQTGSVFQSQGGGGGAGD
eukprot:COSAG01_NODE_6158_length_3819_cov_76.902151_1_plen_122_part_10